jgi:hypothetical protein
MALQSSVLPWSLLQFRNLFYKQTVRLLGRVINPSQAATYTQENTNTTFMPWVGFKHTIPAFERKKTFHNLDSAATSSGIATLHPKQFPSMCQLFYRSGSQPLWHRPPPSLILSYKTRARYNRCQGPVSDSGPAVEKIFYSSETPGLARISMVSVIRIIVAWKKHGHDDIITGSVNFLCMLRFQLMLWKL